MSQSDDNFGSAVGFLVLAVVGFFIFGPTSCTNEVWYGVEYGVKMGDVHTDAKPTDCDFMHAPLGNKECSYKAHVKAYNAGGVLVGGEDAPKYGHDTKTGRPIFSYNDGKTWDWYPEDTLPDQKVASVKVFWIKNMD